MASQKPEIGDMVEVTKGKQVYKGILMPRAEGSDPEHIAIKLNSGYNIGIRSTKNGKKVSKVKVLKKQSDMKAKPIPRKLTFSSKKPKIALITTGGTITSKIDYTTGAVTSLMSPDELLDTAPELAKIANIEIITPFQKMSENMTTNDWKELARTIADELNKKNIKGVIVTHGTDILHYTSSILSFMLKNLNKPVVLVGSQRSSDRPSSDGHINLVCAAHLALSDIAEVGICMHATINDDYCIFSRGTKVRKMHTSRRDAFRPINDLPLARVWIDGKIEPSKHVRKRITKKVELDNTFEEKIALIKFHPNQSPDILDYYEKNSYKGIVIEATGLGHLTWDGKNSWLPKIKSLIEKGIPVCIAPQTLYGRVNLNVYTGLRLLKETGAIPLEDMLPETAFVKLGWIMGHVLPADSVEKIEHIRKEMLKNYSGEIQERSLPETFLY
ncbi:Glu-tRNA(Gln) amidotransferase GatDE subunit D [archaeon]|nr:Glu-tRNA(Gln) amidotransferase GatDE subunit D [archaeon]